jgi:hypothetical protein
MHNDNPWQEWTTQLTALAKEPLEYCPNLPNIAQRLEAWWGQANDDRPVFLAASVNPGAGRAVTRRLDLLEDADAWLAAKVADMEAMHRVGDTLPQVRADFGPVLLGGMLGGRLEFGSDTGWTHAFIDDNWSNAPDWQLRDDNHWWVLLRELSERAAHDAQGRYLFCTPDLGGMGDVLLNLRGSSQLCMDVLQRPETIRAAVDAMYPAWQKAFRMLYGTAHAHKSALIHWLGLWSSQPYVVPACDFNYMISPDDFEALLLPDVARQVAEVGRAIFHLDGPGAARHIDTLLEVPNLQIQFTPGAGSSSIHPWIEMFQKVQAKGRSLLVICPPEEVLDLSAALKPEGLGILIDSPPAPQALDELFGALCKQHGV